MKVTKNISLAIFIQFSSIGLVSMFISPKFKDCKEFFKDEFLPKNYPPDLPKVEICQRLQGTVYYATMYDLRHKTALYSAYKLDNTIEDVQPPDLKKWFVELGLSEKGGDMGDEKELTKTEKEVQAINKDYTKAPEPVIRGQMAPKCHKNQEARTATFTLTNAAPLYEKVQAVWQIVEEETKKLMQKKCLGADDPGNAFFVAGPIPGPQKISEKVNIPTHVYSAAACDTGKPSSVFSFGVLGPNDEIEGSPKDIPILVTDVVNLGKKIKEKWTEPPPPPKPIKFFEDNGNAGDKSAVKDLKIALRKRGVNVFDEDPV